MMCIACLLFFRLLIKYTVIYDIIYKIKIVYPEGI